MNRRPAFFTRPGLALAIAASILLLWQHAFAQRHERGLKSPDETSQREVENTPTQKLAADSDLFQTTTKSAQTRRPLFKGGTNSAEPPRPPFKSLPEPAETDKTFSQTSANAADTEQPVDKDDILWEARRENAGQGHLGQLKPFPTKSAVFRSKARSFPLQRRPGGHYRLQVVQGRPMLSPAAVDGKVFIGGGFASREVHCLDARTGRTRWTANLGDNGPASPAYHDGVVVYNTESCTTYALDAARGRPLWSAYLGDPLIAMPAVGGGSVLASHRAIRQTPVGYPRFDLSPGSIAGLGPQEAARQLQEQAVQWAQQQAKGRGYQLSALDLKTGRPRWSRWIDQQVISAPVVYGEDVYITTFAGTLYKFRLADGEILIARRCRATSAPVIVGDGIFFTSRVGDEDAAAECISKIDRITGKPIYSAQQCNADYLRPRGSRALKYSQIHVDAVDALRPLFKPARLVGRAGIQELQEYSGSRLLAFEGRLFNTMGPEFLCTDPDTGERQWSFSLASAGYDGRELAAGPPAVAGGRLFVATLAGELLQVDPQNGSIEKRIPLGAPVVTEPIIEQGRAFLATRDGQLLCVNLGDEQFTGWHQWGGGPGHCGPADAYSPGYQLSQTGR